MKKIISLALVCLLLVGTMLSLASCGAGAPNSDPDKALAALKAKDYEAEKLDGIAMLAFKDAKCVIMGVKESEEEDKLVDGIYIIYYKSADDAKDHWDDIQDFFDKMMDEADEEEVNESDWIINQSGAMIYFGTKTAVADAK